MSANRPYVIGLTGGTGSGKTTAALALEECGAYRVDADAISRSLTAPGGKALGAIREAFGDPFFAPDGSLDRRAMADAVFRSDEERRRLEGILHPMVRAEMEEEILSAGRRGLPLVLLDVPLLFEAGMEEMCDETWAVTCPVQERARRVMLRDGISYERAMERIACQMSDGERARRADRTLANDTTAEEFAEKARALCAETLRRISGKGNA